LDAIEALILVVNLNGPTMFARIGMMRALNHGKESGVGAASETGEGLPDLEMTGAASKRGVLQGTRQCLTVRSFVPYRQA